MRRSKHPLNVLSWLRSRRQDVAIAIYDVTGGKPLVFCDRPTIDEVEKLLERLDAFETLIEQERARQREARRALRDQEVAHAKIEVEQPRPRPPDHKPWREIRFTIPVDAVLPVPVRDGEDTPDGASHFIQDDIDRQADTIVSRGYATMGRRRNRRYEGYRS